MTDITERLRKEGVFKDVFSGELKTDPLCLDAIAEIEALRQSVKGLENNLQIEIKLRPQWAQGYSSDSIAAQLSTSALTRIWNLLDVGNQTDAIRRIDELMESESLRICADHDANELAKELAALKAEKELLINRDKYWAKRQTRLDEELAALKSGRNALDEFNEHWTDADGSDPVERLRFFCSLAMRGQDWLDVEPFFDALKAGQGEPVAWMYVNTDGECEQIEYGKESPCEGFTQLFTSTPSIPEGWQLVPIEPTQAMRQAWRNHKDFALNAWEAMLSAAPKQGEKE